MDRHSFSSRGDTGPFEVRPADPASFSTFRISPLRHNFDRHPLMQLPALARLAHNLAPLEQCRFIKPGSTQVSYFDHGAKDPRGLQIDEVFDRIEEPGSWVALYNVERDPTYREFLEREVLPGLRPLVDREQPGTYMIHGFIFISAPPSVTPFHIDRENNFWLQVKGRKTLNVWDHRDREVVAARVVDEFILYGGPAHLDQAHIARSQQFEVGPGEGVYWPSTSPHMTRSDPGWVTPGDGVSVSIGIVFYTPHMRRMANIHAWNYFLRRLGITPRAPGDSPLDGVKHAMGRLLVWAKKTFRGYQPSAGLL